MRKKQYGLLLAVIAGMCLGACGSQAEDVAGELQDTEEERMGNIENSQQEAVSQEEAGGTEDLDIGDDMGTGWGTNGADQKITDYSYDREKLTWELVWSDEFDYEGAPDPEKWGYDVGGGGWGNDELQYYTEGDNATVKDGCLVIEARKEDVGGREYTSGRLVTRGKGDWLYGKIEVCAKLPSGLGTWPAAWLLPTDWEYGQWPASGEIDIMEHVGYDQDVIVHSVHNQKFNGKQSRGVSYHLKGVSEDFHVYTLEWLPDKLIFSTDGMERYTYDPMKFSDNPDYQLWPFDRKMHILLNLAFGGSWGGAKGTDESCLPAAYYIDYVRVYQSPEIKEMTDSMNIKKQPLHVENGKILDYNGKEVVLRGVNLGGWLIQESWMCPVNGEDRAWANLDTLNLLESRFSEEEVQTLLNTYQDNWITEEDIQDIASLGCNVIRVPFWYRNFMKDEQGTWISENPDENPGFQRLDWVIDQAEKNGMYVILDMHGCPGGQSMDHCCGTLCQNRLYTDQQCQETMEKLWVAIAERYKDCGTVAAYDIMNEPQNNSGYDGENSYDPWNSESWKLSNLIYDRMIKAIRQVDQEHIITVEGIWRISNLPDPDEMGWTNMMYQLHLYDGDDMFRELAEDLSRTAERYNVAAYVGEFQNMHGLGICNEYGISWTTWTYKGTNNDVGDFFWYFGKPEKADCEKDSYEEILRKWGDPIRTEHFAKKLAVYRQVEQYAVQ